MVVSDLIGKYPEQVQGIGMGGVFAQNLAVNRLGFLELVLLVTFDGRAQPFRELVVFTAIVANLRYCAAIVRRFRANNFSLCLL